MGKKVILHIDFDSFFASVEQQHDPTLRNKPIGVTATNGRTCIIASSREAKRLGIKTGTRSFEAFKLCPSIKLVPADFVKYWEISKKFIAICKDYTPYVEVFSIDELFMDVTKTAHLFGGVECIIARIKERIRQEAGEYITVSVGISHNKLLAKLASGLQKPNGVVKIGLEDITSVYAQAKLTDICGIGERIKDRLNAMGIYTLLQLRSTPVVCLVAEFGSSEGTFLRNIGQGIDNNPIIPYTVAPTVKSVGRNYCLPHNEYDKRIVLQNIYELCEEVSIKLRRLGKKARLVGINLRGNVNIHSRKTYLRYFDTGAQMFQLGMDTIDKRLLREPSTYVRQISVWAGMLEEKQCTSLSLFPSEKRNEHLVGVIDRLNNKFGHHTIRNGFLLYADKLTTVPNGYLADKYERTKLASALI